MCQQPDQFSSNPYHPAGAQQRRSRAQSRLCRREVENGGDGGFGGGGLTANSHSSTSSLSEERKRLAESKTLSINFKCSKFFAEIELGLVDW